MAKHLNKLSGTENICLYSWIKENWKSKVEANKWHAEETAKRASKDLGFRVTEHNIRAILTEFFPGCSWIQAAPNPENPISLLKRKADSVDALQKQIDDLKLMIKNPGMSVNDSRDLANAVASLTRTAEKLNARITNLAIKVDKIEKLADDCMKAIVDMPTQTQPQKEQPRFSKESPWVKLTHDIDQATGEDNG